MAIGPHLSFPHADLFRLRTRIFNLTKVSSPPAGGTAGKSCGRHAFRAVCVHVRVSVCAHVRPYARAGARVCAWVVGRIRCTCVFAWRSMCFAEARQVSLPRARCRVCVRVSPMFRHVRPCGDLRVPTYLPLAPQTRHRTEEDGSFRDHRGRRSHHRCGR